MRKTVTALILVLVLCMSTVSAFAVSPSEVYIDATQLSQEEMNTLIANASAEKKTIIIDWKDGTTVRLTPESDTEIELYINKTSTLYLNFDWTLFGHCNPLELMPSQLKVTNYSENPGSIDVKIRNDRVIGTYYIYSIAPGYTGELVEPYPYDIYLRACDERGYYKVKASDWVI